MKPLTMKIKGIDIIGYDIDERYNEIYFFDTKKRLIIREQFYIKQFKRTTKHLSLEKHLIGKFGDKQK